ncbi:MAG: shikimate kinase [Planctomycetota bacterium]|nr:shikimate kinase [Planctomycetota bacterium]
MRKVVVLGNSGSGKSTLAQALAASEGLAHFGLDTVAWLPTDPPQRAAIAESEEQIMQFIQAHEQWVIEGCYADLIAIAARSASEMVFLHLSVADCLANAAQRPFEPHKYPSKAAQDANLAMLVEWIKTYPTRDDICSLQAHLALYDRFGGKKTMCTQNNDGLQ